MNPILKSMEVMELGLGSKRDFGYNKGILLLWTQIFLY